MTHQAIDLAENKLSILYFVRCLGIPLTNSQITRFFVENNIINYFDLQQLLIELVSGGFLDYMETRNNQFFGLAPKGAEALNYFKKRISPSLRSAIERYGEQNRARLKRESQIFADYKKLSQKEYEITCKVMEGSITLLELKLNVPTVKQAKTICENWNNRAPEIYKAIMDRLI